MFGSDHYKWYQSRSLTLVWGFVPFGPIRDVYSFGIAISWDKKRMLHLHGGFPWHYISMNSFKPSRNVLKL